MTVNAATNKVEYVGDGTTTTFSYSFRVDDPTWIKVYFDGTEQTSGFTVDNTAKTVTFDTAPGVGVVISIMRILPYDQLVNYLPYDPFPAETHEAILDKIVMMVQQLDERIDRAYIAPPGTPPVGTQIPASNVTVDDSSMVIKGAFLQTWLQNADADIAAAKGLIPATTRMLFHQASAPAGWTIDSAITTTGMIVVDQADGGASGGTDDPLLNDKVPAHTHTMQANGLHVHYTNSGGYASSSSNVGFNYVAATDPGATAPGSQFYTSSTGSHTHTINDNINAANWTPRYSTVIVASKD